MKKLTTLSNSDAFDGKVKNGFPVGKGTYYYHSNENSIIKEGSFKTGKFKLDKEGKLIFEGKGKLIYDAGEYEGDIYCHFKHGKGVYKFNNGIYYEGGFKNDIFDDLKGKIVLPDGSKYVGPFINGQRTGTGEFFYANGDHFIGEFVDGVITGEGVLTMHDGSCYSGDFVNGAYEGHGEYVFANGNRYVGEFKNNTRTGKGTFYYYTGKIFEGNFENNEWKGKGKFIYEDKTYLTGDFDGFNSKLVERYYNENSKGFGYFINGEYIEVTRSTTDPDALSKALRKK